VTHVAQNPTDWKHVHFGLAQPGSIVGCDFAGIVVNVGRQAIDKHLCQETHSLIQIDFHRKL